ncbi:Peptidase, M20/M25/M40 family [hydrothermal vent metagenome]|uniref:Vacuolar membrane protease n=1 Tax=hydrothermal vent metagenome TaxID=652676 RepID=A0A3B0TFE2_9ZZZZ
MKKSTFLFTLVLILLAIYWSFHSSMPVYESDASIAETSFSTDRALEHVKQMTQKPHAVGFKAHHQVREYVIAELKKMDLKISIQEGYTAGDWGNFSKAVNILAKIKGSESGKALMLLSHYDSSAHSSLGASDAASGVATILEGLRAFLAENKNPKNDIIILISDAEELGLNGADLFVNSHPWAKEVGLVLNFEARGSGGPSYVLIETNRGNGNLIKEFTKADPEYPVANSLVYSIYKMLPNDTDLTVFREDGDVEGFNFAFIDDHYDYHTAKDTYERLDKNTLAHQGSYLMPLLDHFSTSDLSNLKSLNDYIYFNVPFFKLVSYPFEWIWPMFGLAVLFFIILLIHGFRKKVLDIKEVLKGLIPLLLALAINGLVGFCSWPVLKWMYPQYEDMLHGFTYNGYTYIAAFVLFSIGICFWVYHKFKKIKTPNVLVAPIVLWLAICGLVAVYLQGASFFIVPVFALLAAFLVTINQERPSAYLLLFLALPAIFIFAPFIKMFPVGLGLKMMVATTVLTTLTFALLLPVFQFYRKKNRLAFLSLIFFFGCMISAHFNVGFSKENAKPTSLMYVLNTDTNTAQWATYENQLSDWTAQYLGTDKKAPEKLSDNTISSKYGTGFTFISETPVKELPIMKVEKSRDTIIGNNRFLDICITPQRNVNRLEVYTNDIPIEKASVNTVALSDHYLKNRRKGRLLTHYVSNNEYTDLQLSIPKDSVLELTLYEASNDLLTNSQFSVPERPENCIPMPFVLNDAILVIKTIRFE